jgi:hypothetical protein
MSFISRLRQSRSDKIFSNSLPLTARLAWGYQIHGDPDLSTWLASKDYFERHGNGVVLFAPRLIKRAECEASGSSIERLKGLVRWRHVVNTYANNEIGKVIAALRGIGSVNVAGGWSDFTTGRKVLSEVHIGDGFIGLRPYNEQLISNALEQLGWKAQGQIWRPKVMPRGRAINLHITPELDPFQWPSELACAGNIWHADGPYLTLLLAQRALNASSPRVTLQLLDRILDDLPDRSALKVLRDHADKLRHRRALDDVLALIERICGGEFEAQLPQSIDASS